MAKDGMHSVLYTRPEATPAFERILRDAGITAMRIPLIRIAAPESWSPLDDALARLAEYDGIILTSVQAVRWFARRLPDCGIEEHMLPPLHVVGAKTAAAVKEAGLHTQDIPSSYYGATLAEEMSDVRGKRYLQPTSDIARDELVQVLRERGADVDQVTAYRTLPALDADIEKLQQAAALHAFDCAAFFSPSAVRQFREALPQWTQLETRIAVIGDTTAAEAESRGLRVDIIAPQQTAESLAESIAEAMQDE
ncbi:uroporphyrinogen-III synthase [bacterium]|nr:uroporphyrinogen-III synthase [bacterium]